MRGREHWDNVQKTLTKKPRRVAVTLKVLKFLKRVIKESKWTEEKKLRIWLICCLLFNGSLRVHEALSKTKEDPDPLTTLYKEDLELVKDNIGNDVKSFIRIHLKSPKENRVGAGVKLEIFENNTFCCPVKALTKWQKWVTLRDNEPVFQEGGVCFTGKDFNKILSSLTSRLTDGTDGVIRPHSFRSGMATEMGKMGFTDSEIQQQGRWSSQSFSVYIKMNRLKRLHFTQKIGEMIQKC